MVSLKATTTRQIRFSKNKTNLKDRSDVIYKYKVDESVNENMLSQYGKGPKPIKPTFKAATIKDGNFKNLWLIWRRMSTK